MQLSIVVALAENRTIGKNNGLPWRLPEDLKHFKEITLGHPIIMGRLTYESIGRPLPGRTNIIVTRQKNWQAPNVCVAHALDDAIGMAGRIASGDGKNEIMVIGGANIYEQALPICTRLYLTQVHAEVDGDAFFPPVNVDQWQERSRTAFDPDARNPYPYSFITLDRL